MWNIDLLDLYSNNLKQIRNKLNISVKDLSNIIGIPERTICSYERKERLCSTEIITLLSKKMHVNANWFVTGNGEMFLTKVSTIGDRILKVINQSNISKCQMAVLLSIDELQLENLINGSDLPNLNILNALKQKFKISINWLLYGE